MRAICFWVSSRNSGSGNLLVNSMESWSRMSGKPECISLERLRAIARASNRAGAPAADAAVVIAPAVALRSAGVVLTLAF